MHMIPPQKPAVRLVEQPDGPQILAVGLWDGDVSADAIRQRAKEWMPANPPPLTAPGPAMEAIAWAQGFPLLEKTLDAADYRALGDLLCGFTNATNLTDMQARPLVHQLLAAELALTLVSRSTDARLRRRMEKSGCAALALGLSQIVDSQGALAAEQFHLMRPLLACWTRCRTLTQDLGHAWGPRSQQRFDRLLRNILRMARPDGGPPLASDSASDPSLRLLEAAIAATGDAANRQIAALALGKSSAGATARRLKKASGLPPAPLHCEERSLAVLRRGWDRNDERLVVRFAGQVCEMELVAAGRVALSGEWRFAVARQGQPLAAASDWESICWHSDSDVDYLELQIELAEGVILQRHMALARQDRFLLMADAILAPQPGGLEYCGTLPLAAGIDFCPAAGTREGLIAAGSREQGAGSRRSNGGRPIAQVLPLALPEWRDESRGGELAVAPRGLELRQATPQQRLFAPLFIDLDRNRLRRRLTWRTLTVAESLVAVPQGRAVGYRVAIGKQQWLIYRSLDAVSNRTLLGHNLSTETLVARFGTEGEVTSIIEIE